jgi:hypothetical protein
MTVVVKAESLTKRFSDVPAVTDLSFAPEAGTITGFLGPNGAGAQIDLVGMPIRADDLTGVLALMIGGKPSASPTAARRAAVQSSSHGRQSRQPCRSRTRRSRTLSVASARRDLPLLPRWIDPSGQRRFWSANQVTLMN